VGIEARRTLVGSIAATCGKATRSSHLARFSLAVRSSCAVVEISTTVRGIASEVPLSKRDGLPKARAANANSLVTISKTWLDERIAPLRPEKLLALDAALKFSLGLA
jgi:mRNA-degrading endonuclease toxin of MazEF toxin-antitoxin module